MKRFTLRGVLLYILDIGTNGFSLDHDSFSTFTERSQARSNRLQMFYGIDVLKNLVKITRKKLVLESHF